ncbi:dethiobiotin synthase [Chitinophagaceae bacterium LB-8]|uniref:ATP-dependent dethiobiotin synthetase BioD n=1 Tax=Paraflavisolibacter caeni TaxID=2982496 RepID=A0A9X3BGN9_9BACT|nr:dethiobiotin synthase [Paraflavisolibacter caeni]MCU7548107.1 dethiobiotin synthase [Paraflavisolibacter caeni]
MNLVVAGIHTGIGKTVCSAVMVQALGYDYWKPVQAGDLDASDSLFIKKNVVNNDINIHQEAFCLTQAASPHYAAKEDQVSITLEGITIPSSDLPIIVETAGGVMTPLSESLLNIDLIRHLNLPVVLVSNNYLGSINHTLLSVQALSLAGARPLGIVFSGEEVLSTREFILQYTGLPLLFSIPQFEQLNKETIAEFATSISGDLKTKLYELGRER